MTKLNYPLNGSNYVSPKRHQAFKNALDDDHKVECGCQQTIKVSSSEPAPPRSSTPVQRSRPFPDQPGKSSSEILSRALEHTHSHQSRTMEIHQQFLAQQEEYIQLITAVLDQQGNALQLKNGAAAELVKTFQLTLDNFHTLREKGLQVHQEFLNQQAAFSERYLLALENGTVPQAGQSSHSQISEHGGNSPALEWVVQQPPIIVDEQTQPEDALPVQSPPTPSSPPADVLGGITSAELGRTLLDIVAEKTGYPADMLELDMDLEADLGIDSIKRVEILGALEESYPALPPADTEVLAETRTLQEILDYLDTAIGTSGTTAQTAPAPPEPARETAAPQTPFAEQRPPVNEVSNLAGTPNLDHLGEILLEIVAEKTGYPADMLEADMDLEADLGIDSIKRVEILGAMEDSIPGLPAVEAEMLSELRTLGQIVELMGNTSGKESSGNSNQPVTKKKAETLTLQKNPVSLVKIPDPDRLLFKPNPKRPLIVTDDNSDLALETAHSLLNQGWEVLLWSFPDQISNHPVNRSSVSFPVVKQKVPGKESMEEALKTIRTDLGTPCGLIHLHPHLDQGGFFSSLEDQLIKQVFLLAGSLQGDLEDSSPGERNLFLAVIRADGSLGINGSDSFQKGSGLSGLVKSLRWEWPGVFCRYVDLNQQIDPEQASQVLIREISDPNRSLVEVGIGPAGRVTAARENGNNHG